MTTAPTTADAAPQAAGRTASRLTGFAIGLVWAWLFGAVVTLPPWSASPFETALPSSDLGRALLGAGEQGSDPLIWVSALAAALGLAMAVLIRLRPALLGGVALGLAVFLVVGWVIGPWFGAGLSTILVNPVGYTSTVVRHPAVVGVFALVIGLALARHRPRR